MIDVHPLVPEARQAARQAAQVYVEHTRSWFVGLLVHGSALKGGFIPGCSDIDMQVYLDNEAFDEHGSLPLDLCLALHRDLCAIDPTPFAYVQGYALPARPTPSRLAKDWLGPVPGTYHVLLGQLPVPEATREQVREHAQRSLTELHCPPFALANRLLKHGDGHLQRNVRLLCTDVWPTLYQLLVWHSSDPLAVWRLPKDAAIARLPETSAPGQEIRLFDQAVRAYYTSGQPATGALTVIVHGVRFLEAAKAAYHAAAPH